MIRMRLDRMYAKKCFLFGDDQTVFLSCINDIT